MSELGEYMTTKQAAKVLGVHHSTVGQYCQAGELEAVKVGVAWAIKRASVERMVAQREKATNGRTMTTKQAAAVAKPKPRPRPVAKQQARQEPTPWQARPAFDWTASVRARWEDVLHAAISQLRGPGQ